MQRERSEFLGCVSPPFFVFYLTSMRELGSDCSSYGVSLCSTSYYPQKWGTNSRTAGRRAVSCGCCTGRGGTWPVWPPRRHPPCTKGPSRAPNCSVQVLTPAICKSCLCHRQMPHCQCLGPPPDSEVMLEKGVAPCGPCTRPCWQHSPLEHPSWCTERGSD